MARVTHLLKAGKGDFSSARVRVDTGDFVGVIHLFVDGKGDDCKFDSVIDTFIECLVQIEARSIVTVIIRVTCHVCIILAGPTRV